MYSVMLTRLTMVLIVQYIKYWIIMLYSWNLYVTCHLYLNKIKSSTGHKIIEETSKCSEW